MLPQVKHPNEKAAFWRNAAAWPRDPCGYVFLGRAFERIGRAMFGSQWTGFEPTARQMDPPNLSGIVKLITSRADLTREEIEAEQAAALERHREAMQTYERARAVQNRIAAWAEAGGLITSWRAVDGGQQWSIKRELWNTDWLEDRFWYCQMSLDDPFRRHGISGRGFGWIFVEEESLNRLLASQPFAPSPIQTDAHLSPYLKVMLKVIVEWQVTPENQYTKEALAKAMSEAWTGPERLSARLSDAMATLIREPESQAGRAKNKRKSARGVTVGRHPKNSVGATE